MSSVKVKDMENVPWNSVPHQIKFIFTNLNLLRFFSNKMTHYFNTRFFISKILVPEMQ